MPDILILALVVGGACALMFTSTWKMMLFLLIGFFKTAKWVIVVCLVLGVLCCPQMYKAMGWTPMSLLMGDKVYDKALARK